MRWLRAVETIYQVRVEADAYGYDTVKLAQGVRYTDYAPAKKLADRRNLRSGGRWVVVKILVGMESEVIS